MTSRNNLQDIIPEYLPLPITSLANLLYFVGASFIALLRQTMFGLDFPYWSKFYLFINFFTNVNNVLKILSLLQ